MTERPTLVGSLGGRHRARVDERGVVAPVGCGWELDWWIGADDHWRVPAREPSVRQTLLDGAPVVQTAMRVPGGDAIHRVYGAAGPDDPIVVEVENASPAPFVVALVVRGVRSVAIDETLTLVDGRSALVAPRSPSRWAVDTRSTDVQVCSGQASSGPFTPRRDRGGRLEAAFLHPVPHRTTLRVGMPGRSDIEPTDPRALPSADSVARGWRSQLDRGLRIEIPEAAVMDAVRPARAAVLLGASGPAPEGSDVAALEEWGFDTEAAEAWPHLTGAQRRRAALRAKRPATWEDVCQSVAIGGADLLLQLRSFLAHEDGNKITMLAGLPHEWRGAPIEVHDAPTRLGTISYAVRWHGPRPALLWDGPSGATLRAPGLDIDWSTTEPRGETLFASAVSTD